jgi:Kef-type K+ transport system membrane component KefB/nucleotide-binding universal stress UspA family protein
LFAFQIVDSDALNTVVPPSDHELLVFFVQVLVLLVVARSLGQVMKMVGQPSVIGELGAGLILGPSVLGKLAPDLFSWLFPGDPVQSAMLFTVGWLGVVFLLVLTGFETDLALIRALGRATAYVATGSLLVPFIFGLGAGYFMPSLFRGDEGGRLVFALFMGTALSISSLPVIAKVLAEMGLMRRNFGQMTLAAAMANDVVGWIALGVIAGVAQSGGFSVGDLALTLGGMGLFLALALTVGQWAVDLTLRSLRRVSAGVTGSVTTIAVIALAAGVATQAIGVEAVLGAFVAGIVIGRSRFRQPEIEHHIESITLGVFAPIFFATAGLRVDLGLLNDSEILTWGLVVVAVASLSKFIGSLLGGIRADLPLRESAALGAGLNARGALEIVIATVGLSLGVLNGPSYAVIVLMAMVTSMMAPPMLRAIVRNWPGTEEEQVRLAREHALASNLLVTPSRILIPSRGGLNSRLAARIVHLAWPDHVQATVLSAGPNGNQPDLDEMMSSLRGRPVERKRASGDPVEVVLRFAGLGYGVIALGAVEREESHQLLSPFVDQLMARSPLPMVIVRHSQKTTEIPRSFRRILVPAVGTRAARAAQEVAFSIAARLRTDTVLVHVATRPGAGESVAAAVAADTGEHPVVSGRPALRRLLRRHPKSQPVATPRQPPAARVVREAQERAARLGVEASATIREGISTATELVKTTKEVGADLVILGATIREVEGHPFIGHSIEQILEDLDATVVIVLMPHSAGN